MDRFNQELAARQIALGIDAPIARALAAEVATWSADDRQLFAAKIEGARRIEARRQASLEAAARRYEAQPRVVYNRPPRARIAPIGPARPGMSLALALERAEARKGGAGKKAKTFGKSKKKAKLKGPTQPEPMNFKSARPSLALYQARARAVRKAAGPSRAQVAFAATQMIVRRQQAQFAQIERWRAETERWDRQAAATAYHRAHAH